MYKIIILVMSITVLVGCSADFSQPVTPIKINQTGDTCNITFTNANTPKTATTVLNMDCNTVFVGEWYKLKFEKIEKK